MVTVPGWGLAGSAGGAGLGRLGGMIFCMSGNGAVGSGSIGASQGEKAPKEWQITNPVDKKVVGGRTYLKDANTDRWWLKDTSGHGRSVWKVYKETSPGKLEWYRDADAQGNFISGKWKSPVGKSIIF